LSANNGLNEQCLTETTLEAVMANTGIMFIASAGNIKEKKHDRGKR
jgi:hypothetical protein